MSASITKLYLTNKAASYSPATLRGTWGYSTGYVTKALDSRKEDGGVNAYVAISRPTTPVPNTVLLYRGVSGPIAAQTFSGTINCVIGVNESWTSADDVYYWHVYVTQGDTDTPRGTLINNYEDATEWPGSGTGRALNAAQTLGAITSVAGDRIVAEIGYKAKSTSTNVGPGQLWYGTQMAGSYAPMSDLTAGSSSVTTLAPYISFSNAVTEDEITARVTQNAIELIADAVPDGRVTQLAVELVAPGASEVRVSQIAVEIINGTIRRPHHGTIFVVS